ncbi:MAG: poly-beta,6-N-acetyl-D-glucosamine N-deacetylase [Clostridiales bacterium]|jgi:peptidoglycan/xylan/chitin deacetylase (PgdA/CDA1 family)|nr:poly-beta,6-N-acetyl-D-glucosamine N-deacetylase [Clostridiales bacterium]
MHRKITKTTIVLLIILSIFLIFSTRSNENVELDLNNEGCLVLCYHRVIPSNPLVKLIYTIITKYSNDDELKLYSILSSDFNRQMKYLKKNGAHFITPLELENYIKNKDSLPPKSVLITFDDVDVSTYRNAFPILQKEKIPFTLFVITGHIGDQNFKGLKLSTISQIQEMINSGLATVGSHTHNFHYLSKEGNPPFMNPKNHNSFAKDIKLSFETLETNFKVKEKYFCYPYGFGTPETDEILLNLDINLIFTLKPGIVKSNDPAFYIKRVLVTQETWKSIVKWVEKKVTVK